MFLLFQIVIFRLLSSVFLARTPQKPVLFEILTSDDIQHDASDMLQLLLKY